MVSSPQRRRLIQSLGLLTAAPWLARAEPTPDAAPLRLPLHLTQLVNHIGTSVPDVTRSATFYSHVFQGGRLLGQEKPALRYEIEFHPGSVSIGPLRTGTAETHPYIDHFCLIARPFDAAAWRARLAEEMVRDFAGGSFVVIGGISVQLFGGRTEPPAGKPSTQRKSPPAAAGGFSPMAPLYAGESLVRPHGFEHLTLHVADLEASAALFEKLFGLTAKAPSSDVRLLQLEDTRIELRRIASGERPGIETFAIRVAAFDPGRVREALEGLGAKPGPIEKTAKRTILRFADPDGIECELWA